MQTLHVVILTYPEVESLSSPQRSGHPSCFAMAEANAAGLLNTRNYSCCLDTYVSLLQEEKEETKKKKKKGDLKRTKNRSTTVDFLAFASKKPEIALVRPCGGVAIHARNENKSA